MSRATATISMNDKGIRKMRNCTLLERITETGSTNILNTGNQRQIDKVNVADITLAGSIR